jgi:hypothetical protein
MIIQRPFRNPQMLGRAEEASADSTVGSTASELPEAQRRRWGFLNGLKNMACAMFLFFSNIR